MKGYELSKLDAVSAERIWRHHGMLCREIGQRILGTENDRLATEYIESHFLKCGLETSSQIFDCPSWDHRSTTIYNSCGYKIIPPEGGACMFSLPCDVTGEIVNLTTVDELINTNIRGKICVISGELKDAPIRMDRNPLLLLLEEKSPLVVIIVDSLEHGYMTKHIRDPHFQIPVCCISASSGARILEDGGIVTVKIDAKRFKSTSRNIFASNTNIESDTKKIRIIAHHDTSDTTGATDNASGTSIILEVAEAIKDIKLNIPIEFIAFGGEEYAGLGATEYENKFSNRIDNTSFVINIDAVGGCNCEPRIYLGKGYEELNNVVLRHSKLVGNYHNVIFGDIPLMSDHRIFCKKNIPTVLINHKGIVNICDTSLDNRRIVSLERLENVARIIVGVLLDMNALMID